jgi:prepilin-type N-terminal cleavage/methylation domain-containing protein
MKLPVRCSAHARGLRLKAKGGFTLVEVMVAVAVMGIMFVSLYAGFAFGFAQIQLSRENDRATQILEEKMEVVRLLNWDQVVNIPGYIPTSFTAPFYANNPTNSPSGSFTYTGTVTVTNVTSPQFLAQPVTETYKNDLRLIQIQVSWPSGKITRTRRMTTFVSQYGLQKYVY